jgi:tetraacyldisaccharide 4'-kinase
MKILKPKFWTKKNSLIGFFLIPFSFFFQILIHFRNITVKRKKVSIPVICVGNIYVGGTGKTPLSIEIVKTLERLNKKTALIKKSYKEHLDEFKLVESKGVTLFKDSTRYNAIVSAIKNGFECVVLDDGYQDLSINKNLNIVCFSERQLVGNGMTLPSGPLREPISSLKRCQIVVINGGKNFEFEKTIKNISNNISIYYSRYIPINIEKFKNKNLLAFAGIGNPDNFFNLLKKNNINLIKKISFPDHHKYSLKELNNLINFSLQNGLELVTTEKDLFRIKHFQLSQIKSLNVKLEISNKEALEKEVSQYI